MPRSEYQGTNGAILAEEPGPDIQGDCRPGWRVYPEQLRAGGGTRTRPGGA